MRQRLTLTGVLVATIALVVLAQLDGGNASLAFADVTQSIRNAKTFSVDVAMEIIGAPGGPKPPAMKQRIYWRAPGDYRFEQHAPAPPKTTSNATSPNATARGPAERPSNVRIFFLNKPGIDIDHRRKVYRTEAAHAGKQSPLMILHSLGKYRGEAMKQLGEKSIDGVPSVGFQIAVSKIDPNAGKGSLDIWVDQKSQLPTMIVMEMPTLHGRMTMKSFQWNQQLPDKLFAVEPPQGYKEQTRDAPELADTVRSIQEALKLYAELSGGHYPQVDMVYGDVTRNQMLKMAGYDGIPSQQQRAEKEYQRIVSATRGLAAINVIQRTNADSSFHGKDVGPKDADKILLQWRLTDGRTQRIYGDLRAEVVGRDADK